MTISVDDIDALLPQTQCTRCGYAGCRPYAEALAARTAAINQCPPGGAATIAALAALLGKPVQPLNPANGIEAPPLVAQIDEELCIGCAKCLPPCPTDAIVGAHQQMHTVVLALCTGCELCIAPCPVDCIAMVPREVVADAPPAPSRDENRRRFLAHQARTAGRAAARSALLTERKRAPALAGVGPER
ncbi:MAG TPA: RnfABCDGE type electron transport complex subunit B [Steroidobacteraceae bacterium]|nr:RnfABCDGE type electron transport complex subunit B [Steroidobacteraceae bacterium]